MRVDPTIMALLTALQSIGLYAWIILRPVLGWSSLTLGVLGMIVPIVPGIPFLVLGTVLIGRRTWLIRWMGVHWKLTLRRWATLRTPLIGPLGRWAWRVQQETSRQRRRFVWWYWEVRQKR